MTAKFETNNSQDERQFNVFDPTHWVAYVTYIITAGITSLATIAITILVLVAGGWLLYTYLPNNIFNIVMAVILIDILIGVAVRFVVTRRNKRIR